jgi:hypothetical protein
MKTQITFLIVAACLNFPLFTNAQNKAFTEPVIKEDYKFFTTAKTDYFILEPGYQLVLEGKEGKDFTRLVITVGKETRKIGEIETRIVEENESVNGNTVEISRNYFAFCQQTNSVYYFGEEVDIYKDGKIVNHEGAWLAEGKNKPGIAMPGLILLGSRYYQEFAPGVAMDRAEIISDNETFITPAGKFNNVLRTEESSPLEPFAKEFKLYAPGIGLIKDESLLLVKYGFIE